MNQIAFENVVAGINWTNTDTFLSTPLILESMLKLKDRFDPFEVDPEFIVIDELDLLLGDSEMQKD